MDLTAARRLENMFGVAGRKVRAPQGMMPGNSRAPGDRGQTAQQKANRQPVALAGQPAVRVKWWGKSPPRRRRRGRKDFGFACRAGKRQASSGAKPSSAAACHSGRAGGPSVKRG